MRLLPIAVIALFSGLTACGEDDRPASWSYIHAAIIIPNCTTASCHSDRNEQAGIDLEDSDRAYQILTGGPCTPGEEPPGLYAIPGAPESSRLVFLLKGEGVAVPMPADRLLPAADVALIEQWILEGALCN